MAVVFDEVIGTVQREPAPPADSAALATPPSESDEHALYEELQRLEERQRRLRAE